MGYLVFTGNEYGLEIDLFKETDIVENYDTAKEKYDKYLKEYDCAVLFEITPTSIKPILKENYFIQ